MYGIPKGLLFEVGMRSVIASSDIHIGDGERGYFVIDLWEECTYGDISVLPVAFFKYETLEESESIKSENIILGGEEDICLI